MTPIRVLIVDDSAVVRKCLTDLFSNDSSVVVAGTAPTGSIGIARFSQLQPDLVILDLEMPEMDGLSTLANLRRLDPRVPVLIFSSHSERGASITLDALSNGANDYLHKPGSAGGSSGLERLRDDLVSKIKVLTGRDPRRTPDGTATAARSDVGSPSLLPRKPDSGVRSAMQPPSAVEVVAIGISTGGPQALSELLPLFPATFPVPILIVQHMPSTFTKLFAERLNQQCDLLVQEARSGVFPQAGEVWIAPGDFHLEVQRRDTQPTLVLHRDPPENSCRPSVDPLFRSVAACYGSHVLGIIMTGMGRDGLAGCRAIKSAGGAIFAQDEASSVVWGMPGFVVAEALADRELALSEMASAVQARVGYGAGQSRRSRPSLR